MNREQAIAKLKNFADHCQPNEEFLIAIEAIEQVGCLTGKNKVSIAKRVSDGRSHFYRVTEEDEE